LSFHQRGELRNSCISEQQNELILNDATTSNASFYVPLPFALDLIDHCVGLARGAGIVDLHLSARFPES
jgi:hypothetical protein